MKVLCVNAGSSSLKFSLFEMPEATELINGTFERIGMDNAFYSLKFNGEKIKKEAILTNHKQAFELLVKELIDNQMVADLKEIDAIGHRTVHGGDHFSESVLATLENIKVVEELSPLAPLHNPPGVVGIRSALEVFPAAKQVLVFDTAFHQTMKEPEFLYPVPYVWYKEHGVRKYGFHGTSHKYVSKEANRILNKPDTKVITCHIGNGASLAAIKNGKCIDTSMGLTPNSGLMMGTRCGDIDTTILNYMVNEANLTIKEIDETLNKTSGLLGISGLSSDLRDIEDGYLHGDERCILALEMYTKRIAEYIIKYYMALEGCDLIAFTAGVGEKSPLVRKLVINKLNVFGIKIDEDANKAFGAEAKISSDDSSVLVYTIPTNEELMIATDTYDLAK